MSTRWVFRALAALTVSTAACTGSAIARQGMLDPGFGEDGIAFVSADGTSGHQMSARAVLALPDGRILLGGSRNRLRDSSPDPERRPLLARLNVAGSIDDSFGEDRDNPGTVVFSDLFAGTQEQSIESITTLADGSILAVGTATAFGPTQGFVLKLDAGGRLADGFGERGVFSLRNAYLHAIAVDAEGRILLAGEHAGGTPFMRGVLLRLLADGTLDPAFGVNGEATLALPDSEQLSYLGALAIDADGSIVVGGHFQVPRAGMTDNYDFSVARFTSAGVLDPRFATTGWRTFDVEARSDFDGIDRLFIDAQGRIVFGGHYRQFGDDDSDLGINVLFGRLQANGATDESFGEASGHTRFDLLPDGSNRYVSGLVQEPDGHLLANIEYASSARQVFMLVRSTAEGVPDNGFGKRGVLAIDVAPEGPFNLAHALTLHEGRPLVAGIARRSAGSPLVDIAVARLADNDVIFASGFEAAPGP